MRIRQRQCSRSVRIGSHVALAQLGENNFERLTEAVQYTHAVAQRHYAIDVGDISYGFALHSLGEGEVRLRVVRMHEECCATGDVGLKQMHPRIGRVPALDNDVVQLIAQELVDYALVFAVDLEEV